METSQPTIVDAILSLRPKSQWSLNGSEYSNLVWLDTTQSKPTEQEVNDELYILLENYLSVEYQRSRAKEYPSYADQFDLLYHGGYDAWKASISSIKNKYPKP